MIAVNPPVVIPEEKIPLIASGAVFRISGINSTPSPNDKLTASTSVAFRLISYAAIIRIPAAATVPNINKVAPPRTGSGIKEKITPTTGNNPNRINIPAI